MKQLAYHYTIIVSVALLVLFTNLGAAPLWDRDEPRNAGCALEMMERGDWVVPIFNDQLRDAKPVLLYWLMMSAYAVFGVNEFSARFWSASLALGTVIATYHIGRRLFHPNAALWSAVVLATGLMFGVAGRAATPDSVLIFCGTMALTIYVLGTFQYRESTEVAVSPPSLRTDGQYFPSQWWVCVLMYCFMGLGILAKGPVGLVLPTAVIGMFLLIKRLPPSEDRRWWVHILRLFAPLHFLRTCWSMRPVTAIIVALAIAAPWFVLVGLRTEGDYLLGFFVKEHIGRATTAMENHSGSLLFYPVAILAGFFPWSVFAVPLLIWFVQSVRKRDAWNDGYVLLACWTCVYIGIFTLATTKLPSYVTPCYPALALLTGSFLYRWSCGTLAVSAFWLRLSLAVLGLVGLAMLIAIPLAAQKYLPGEQWLGAIGVILIVGAGVCFVLLQQRKNRQMVFAFALTAVSFTTVFFGIATVQVGRHQENRLLFNAIADHSERPQVGSYRCLESTWVFYVRRPILELSYPSNDRGATALPPPREKNWHRHPGVDVVTFLKSPESFVITTDRHFQSIRSEIPDDVHVLATARYFLKKEDLVLLGRQDPGTVSAQGKSATKRR